MRPRSTSLRLRLTLSYGAVFFALGCLLIALSYVLVRQVLISNPDEFLTHVAQRLGLSHAYLTQTIPAPGGGQQTVGAYTRHVQDAVVAHLLHGLTVVSFFALAIAILASVGLGWIIAGRMLRPVHEIATVARRLSATTLHERIALQGPRDELRDLADTFDAMLARLESAFAAQREFVANASHELRTPLAIMRTELDVTLADPEADVGELRRMAETIRDAIGRSEDVIDKLLVLAESEQLGEREVVDLQTIVQGSMQRLDRARAAKGLAFAAQVETAPVAGDALLLERLVDNVLDNAVRYAPSDSAITVTLTSDDARATLRVANAGDVIDPEEVPRLFERFYRRGTSRSRKSGGSGLGMAIVSAVAEAHGGSVRAEAPPSGGLAVIVTLPSAT